jgi:hypothetical protein
MKVKNWKTFQHFKDRKPPWIKLHRDILDRRDIMMISPSSFRLLTFLWLLAAEDASMNGNLPEIEDISFRLRMETKDIVPLLQELTPWIEDIDIKPISSRYQVGLPETETETETYKPETEIEGDSPKKAREKLSDEEWMLSIKTNPAYEGIDITREIAKCGMWCDTHRKQISRKRIVNWLNRIDKPFNGKIGLVIQNQPKTFDQIRTENNLQAARDFIGEAAINDRTGQSAICYDDERDRGRFPV